MFDEVLLEKIVHDAVRKALNECILTEMAVSLSDYRNRVRNVAEQIVTNWCLVRYTDYDERFKKLRKHWSTELKALMYGVEQMRLKKGDDETKMKALYSVWSEYEFDRNEKAIDMTIAGKFEKEGIDTYSKEYIDTISDCKNATKELIEIILSGNRGKILNYIVNI